MCVCVCVFVCKGTRKYLLEIELQVSLVAQ